MVEIGEEEIEKFERHMGKGSKLELKVGDKVDTFILKPLPVAAMPDILRLYGIFSKIKPGSEQEFFDKLDKETTEKMSKLAVDTIKISYPKLSDEKVNAFVSANFMPIVTKVLEINDLGLTKLGPRALKRIKRLKPPAGKKK